MAASCTLQINVCLIGSQYASQYASSTPNLFIAHRMANRLHSFFLLRHTVSKKQHIQTIKFNRCCDRLITFDVTKLVQKWKLYADSNQGILLELTDDLGNQFNVDDYIQTMNCSGRPRFVLFGARSPHWDHLACLSTILFDWLDKIPVDHSKNSKPRQAITSSSN